MILSPRTFFNPTQIGNKAISVTTPPDWIGDVHAFEKILDNLEGNWRSQRKVTLQEAKPKFDIIKNIARF